jgi:hypothetical protein
MLHRIVDAHEQQGVLPNATVFQAGELELVNELVIAGLLKWHPQRGTRRTVVPTGRGRQFRDQT